ncbi:MULTISPECIES: pyruvate kinase alpha/beta domain-containing protein [Agrobacterium]|uniref:pyruvate kinase alpha/beta domain-containing protein n=1 Tax=Agrobacterium TaxID=357 RepID=UPI003B9EE4E9
MVVYPISGTTASRISRARPKLHILALTRLEHVACKVTLMWGLVTSTWYEVRDHEQTVGQAEKAAARSSLVSRASI